MAKSFSSFVVAFVAIVSVGRLAAQDAASPLAPGYYIVVAAYRLGQDSYAKSYMQRINKEGTQARYGADLGRKYLYVYLDYYTDFDQSVKEMLSARKKEGFEKAWVRIMKEQMAEKVNLLTQSGTAESATAIITTAGREEVALVEHNETTTVAEAALEKEKEEEKK